MTLEQLKLLSTHRLQAYYDKHLRVSRVISYNYIDEHECSSDDCESCKDIDNMIILADEVREEISKRPYHKRLKKAHKRI